MISEGWSSVNVKLPAGRSSAIRSLVLKVPLKTRNDHLQSCRRAAAQSGSLRLLSSGEAGARQGVAEGELRACTT